MNSLILAAKIVSSPELRYTQDSQLPFTQMLVEFESLRTEEPPSTLRVVGWGSLASEINENYSQGDYVLLEGRLSMQTYERPEGFKEKRAELVVSHIYRTNGELTSVAFTPNKSAPTADKPVNVGATAKPTEPVQPKTPSLTPEDNLDDIPF